MLESDLLAQLARGEDSHQQFKCDIRNADALAAELAAFANSGGGTLFLGVKDDGSVAGLNAASVQRLNSLLSNAASQNIRPPIHPLTENVQTRCGIVIVIKVDDGLSKPYTDNSGRIWVKQGADKRHVTAREEMQRMFQRSGLVCADTVPVAGTSMADLDEKSFIAYFNRRYLQTGYGAEMADLPLAQLLQNQKLGDGRELNLSGLLLFGKQPQRWYPAFMVKAVAFPGKVWQIYIIWIVKIFTELCLINLKVVLLLSAVIFITYKTVAVSIRWVIWKFPPWFWKNYWLMP